MAKSAEFALKGVEGQRVIGEAEARAEGSARVSAWLADADLLKGRIGRLEIEPPTTPEQISDLENEREQQAAEHQRYVQQSNDREADAARKAAMAAF